MADRPGDDVSKDQNAPKPGEPRVARKGVNDTDSPVHTFGGERVDGAVADTTDGEYMGLRGLFKGKKKK
jgi:hypothetical protein